MDVDQFLNNCKLQEVEIKPKFSSFLFSIDNQFISLKDLYTEYADILNLEELNRGELERLEYCLNGIEKVFLKLRSLIESNENDFKIFEELGAYTGGIFPSVEYISELESGLGINIIGGKKKIQGF